MKNAVLLIVLFLFCEKGFSQNGKGKDDSLKVYRSMEGYAKKKSFTYTLYKAFFRPVSDLNKKKGKKLKVISYEKFEGKIIRNINILTFDPFGYDINDTKKSPDNPWVKAGNKLHLKTMPFAIRNHLLFKSGDMLDELEIKESERILRTLPYLKEVIIYPLDAGDDSVDIYIREIDLWTTIIRFSSEANETKIQLIEKDFLGTGHSFDNSIRVLPDNNNIYEGIYIIPNFKNTFIATTLYYKADFDSLFYKGISINRPFYSPLAKWAGGIAFSNISTSDTLFYTDVIKTVPDVNYNQYDVWGGKSWQLFKGYTDVSRITNLILTARYLNTDFLSNPLAGTDTLGFISDERSYFIGLGVSQRIYLKDAYIFEFGLPEDVPTGQVISFTVGKQNKNFEDRTYLGMRIGWGNYLSQSGYLSANVEYGIFKSSSGIEQGVFSTDISYFTNLLEIGKWKLRQFIKPRLTLGINRFPNDALNINEQNGIPGFHSTILYGTKRLALSTQTQLYAPFSLIGFRFGPFLNVTGALISPDNVSLFQSRLYSSIGFGILIRNELLVLNTFQVSIAYYPSIPGLDNNQVKLNSIKSYDFHFRDFDLEKPGVVTFQ